MNLWMYGLGAEPEHGAALLKELGFTTVVGSLSCAETAMSAGLDAYVFSGAYRGPDFKGEEWLAEDVCGVKREWFASTCPTREEVRQYNLESVRKLASTPGIKGVVIDGCRFASPSSGTVQDAFYTCFCDSCMRKARRMGFDADRMKYSVQHLYSFTHGEDTDLSEDAQGLRDWLEFRRAATTEHLVDFCRTVHEVDPDLQAGIYIFTPALADLVGQSYRDLKEHMDLYCPMIYRSYNDPHGAACLNVETADLLRILEGAHSLSRKERIRTLRALTGLDLPEKADPESIFRGMDAEVLKTETSRARTMIGSRKLVPIIQLDDQDVETASRKTLEGGADAVSYFLYREEWMEERAQAFRRLNADN